MRLSWTSLLLAHLLVPLMFSAVFLSLSGTSSPRYSRPDPDDTELHHLLRHDDVPLPARAISSFPVAAADGPERLPAGPGAGVFEQLMHRCALERSTSAAKATEFGRRYWHARRNVT